MKTFSDYLEQIYGNRPIKSNSNWSGFANVFDIGELDLDTIAKAMNYKNFANLDSSISPKALLKNKKSKFIKTIQDNSILGGKKTESEIIQMIENLK